MVRFLLDNGATPTSIDSFGNLPMDDAIRNGNKKVQALLKERAAIAAKAALMNVHD